MDQPTRRLDTAVDQPPASYTTSHTDAPETSRDVRCLRCQGPMLETRAWAKKGGNNRTVGVELAPRHSVPAWSGDMATATCTALTCADCGYTELYAEDPAQLRALISDSQ